MKQLQPIELLCKRSKLDLVAALAALNIAPLVSRERSSDQAEQLRYSRNPADIDAF
jgi:hypothetical protein